MEVFKHHGRRLTRTNLTRWVLRVQHRASGSTAGLSNPSTHPHLSRTPALCCQRSAAGRFAAPAKLLPWLEAASKAALVKPRSGCLPAQRRPPGAPGCPCSTAPVPPSLHPSFLPEPGPSRAGLPLGTPAPSPGTYGEAGGALLRQGRVEREAPARPVLAGEHHHGGLHGAGRAGAAPRSQPRPRRLLLSAPADTGGNPAWGDPAPADGNRGQEGAHGLRSPQPPGQSPARAPWGPPQEPQPSRVPLWGGSPGLWVRLLAPQGEGLGHRKRQQEVTWPSRACCSINWLIKTPSCGF